MTKAKSKTHKSRVERPNFVLNMAKTILYHNKNRTNSETFLFCHDVTFFQLSYPASSIFKTCSFPQKSLIFAIQSNKTKKK